MRNKKTAMLILLMLKTPVTAALSLKLAENLNYSGSLEHQFSRNKIGNGAAVMTNTSSMRLNLGTFFWRPWIATLSSNIAFSHIDRQNTDDSTGQNITGDINLGVFPQSKFPFRAFYKKRSNQVEGDLTNQDLVASAWGISQSYTVKSTRLNLNYQHLLEKDDSSVITSGNTKSKDVEDTLNLTMSSRLGNHEVSTRSKFNFIKRTELFRRDDQMLHVLRHNYRPGNNLTVNNLFTWNDRSLEQISGSQTDLKIVQLNSNTFWRPETEKPLLVTATALLQGSGELEDSTFGIFDSAGVSAQVNYQWSPYLNLRGQANANKSDVRMQTLQRVGAEYSPANNTFLGFNHAYNVSVDLSNITDDVEEGRQEVNIRAGHIFNRNYPTSIGNINFSATQRGATVLDSSGKLERTLSHTMGIGWNKSTSKSTNLVRLTLGDTRRFSNEGNDFGLQQANLQYTANYQTSRESSINGNITFQANKTMDDSNKDSLDINSSVSVNYSHNRLFQVSRLRLLSELRYLSDSLFEVINSDGFEDVSQNDIFWQNRLYYDLGRLSFRFTTNIGQSNGEFNNFILLQVRRNFGT